MKDAKSVAGFSLPAYFESDRLTSDKNGLLGCQDSFNMVAYKSLLYRKVFLKIADTLEAETSVSGKAEYSLAIGDVAKRVS